MKLPVNSFWDKLIDDFSKDQLNIATLSATRPFTYKELPDSNLSEAFKFHIDCFCSKNRRLQGRQLLRSGKLKSIGFARGSVQGYIQDIQGFYVTIDFKPVSERKWSLFLEHCLEQTHCIDELLRGKLPGPVLEIMEDSELSLFPALEDLNIKCPCRDLSECCKHSLALLYAVAVEIDSDPWVLLKLMGPDLIEDLIARATGDIVSSSYTSYNNLDLENIFGIEVAQRY